MDPIVSAAWLLARLAEPDAAADSTTATPTKIIHVGTPSPDGRDPYEAYLNQRLADALFLSIDDDLAGPPGPIVGRHPLPTPEDFAASLSRIGVGHGDRVVAYDERGGAWAARLVWMLRILGQPAALLDGGPDPWVGATAAGSPQPVTPTERSPLPWPAEALADADSVTAHIGSGGTVIDSRAAARFRGETEPIDSVAGHIPGATNLPFVDNLVDGLFRSTDELTSRFAGALRDEGKAAGPIVYCGSGVTACHNALAIERAGWARPRLYVGSWSGWSTDPERPIATGASDTTKAS